MLVTTELFEKYTGHYGDEESSLNDQYISAAQEVLEKYIGYPLEIADRTASGKGNDRDFVQLTAKPVSNIILITIDGVEYTGSFYTENEFLYLTNGETFPSHVFYSVIFNAGYTVETCPAVITQTILRIAALMLEEAGQNIGVTSKSFDDASRTFVSYASYNKYLVPCAGFKLL